jgi:hypothetical protein
MHCLSSSVVSEPLACVRAACAGVSADMQHVRMISDHQGLVCSAARGYAAARSYNECFVALESLFPSVVFSFAFVAGASNRADPLSRGIAGWSEPESVEAKVLLPGMCSVRVG